MITKLLKSNPKIDPKIVPKPSSDGPDLQGLGQDGPKAAQDSPGRPQVDSKMAQEPPDSPKTAPRRVQDHPRQPLKWLIFGGFSIENNEKHEVVVRFRFFVSSLARTEH